MMQAPRRSSLRFRAASLAFGAVLALAANVASAAPEPTTGQERIEQLWLDAAGTSGALETSAIYLDGGSSEYHFGPAFCGRSHRLGSETMRALQTALATGQAIRVDASTFEGKEQARRCITGVAFFRP